VSFADIGREFGISRQRAYQIYEQALRDVPAPVIAQIRQEESALLDEVVRGLLAIARDEAASLQARIAAWMALVRCSESRRRLYGADSPAKAVVQVIPESVVDSEIERLSRELRARGIDPEKVVSEIES
jgi:hypothetical protein